MQTAVRVLIAIVAIALSVASSSAPAQQATKVPRVAYVWLFGHGPSAPNAEAFRMRMLELGYVDGKNIKLEYRDAKGSFAELDTIMETLVREKVDVIVAMCTRSAVRRKYTTTIPIVVTATGDPVKAGLVPACPIRANVTGISAMSLPLSAKRVDLLKQAFRKRLRPR
jgi:putative ABC transport system substrate-binding protein